MRLYLKRIGDYQISWNWLAEIDRQQSRFFHLGQYLDQLHFVVKNQNTDIDYFFSQTICGSTKKPDEKEKKKKVKTSKVLHISVQLITVFKKYVSL